MNRFRRENFSPKIPLLVSTILVSGAFFWSDTRIAYATIPTSGLVGYWNLDEGSGTAAADTSGSGHDATLVNGLAWTASSYSGNAVAFQGTTDALTASSLDNAAFPTSGTLSFWVKGDMNQNNKPIFDTYSGARNHIFVRTNNVGCGGSGLQIAFQDPGAYRFAKNVCGLVSGAWMNMTISWDSTNDLGYIYLNGSLLYSAPITSSSWVPNQQNFIFGGASNAAASIDDVRLYDRVLSAAETFDLYTAGDDGTGAPETWYSRPSGACAHSGNGKAYGCAGGPGATGAFIGNANISWAEVSGVDDGDTLYVCDEHVSDGLTVPSGASGSSGNRISVRFDCSGDSGSIRMITDMSGAVSPANWINESPDVWYLSTASYGDRDPKRIWVDGTEKIPAQAKANLGASYNGGPVSHWWYDSTNYRLYYRSATNPAGTFSKMESLVQPAYGCTGSAICLADQTVNYVDIVNPRLYGGGLFTLNIRGGDHIRIYGTESDDSACALSLNETLLVIQDGSDTGTGDPARYNEVHDCTVDAAWPASFDGFASDVLGGDGISIRRSSDNRIYSNTVKNTAHAAIYFTSTYTGAATTPADNNVAEDNVLRMDPGLRIYGRAIAVDGTLLAPARDNIFRRNLIDGWTIRSQVNGTDSQVTNNIFRNQRQDPVYSPPRSEMLNFSGYSGVSEGQTVANNVFLDNPHGPCMDFISGGSYGPNRNITIANNVMQDCYDGLYSTHTALYVPNDATGVFDNAYRNNRIFNSDDTYDLVSYRGSSYSVPDFQSACSNGDVCSGNTEGDPLLAPDLAPSSTSPLIDAGVPVPGYAEDYLGNPIYGPSDIGAIEYQPPYDMGADAPDTSGNIRVYGDGKFRDTTVPSGTTVPLSILPASGDTAQYLDAVVGSWGPETMTWAESSETIVGNVSHVVGGLDPGRRYRVSVDGVAGWQVSGADCDSGLCTADTGGSVAFSYSGGYSSHTFTVEATEEIAVPRAGLASVKIRSSGSTETFSGTLRFRTKTVIVKGDDSDIADGTVKISRNGKHWKTTHPDGEGSWSKRLSFKDGFSGKIKIRRYDRYGTLRSTKEAKIEIDTGEPIFVGTLPKTVFLDRNRGFSFPATDAGTGIDHYRVRIPGVRAWRRQEESVYFVPATVPSGTHPFLVRAYDKAGNFVEGRTTLVVGSR